MTTKSDPVRVFLTLEAGLAFVFALAFTLQGLYFVQVAGLRPLELLLIGAALELSAFLLEVPTGVLADVYSRRLSIVLGCVCLGVAMLLVGSFPVFGVLLAAQVVSAAGYCLLSGAQEAWLADEAGEGRLGGLLLLGGQYGRVAGIAGILTTAGLASFGVAVPILAAGGCALLLAAYLAWRMPERGFRRPPPEERHTWAALTGTLGRGVREVRASPALLFLIAAALVYGASTEAVDRLNEFLLIRETGLPGGLSPANWFTLLALIGSVVGWGVVEPLRRQRTAASSR